MVWENCPRIRFTARRLRNGKTRAGKQAEHAATLAAPFCARALEGGDAKPVMGKVDLRMRTKRDGQGQKLKRLLAERRYSGIFFN